MMGEKTPYVIFTASITGADSSRRSGTGMTVASSSKIKGRFPLRGKRS